MKKLSQLATALLMVIVFNMVMALMFGAYAFFNGTNPTHDVTNCIAIILTSGLLTSLAFQYVQYRFGLFIPVKTQR